MKGEGGEKEGW